MVMYVWQRAISNLCSRADHGEKFIADNSFQIFELYEIALFPTCNFVPKGENSHTWFQLALR